MSTHDDNFPAFWDEEGDWVVEVAMLPRDEDVEADLEWIGKLFAFTMATNTRLLAQVGDPDMPAYELWFSFDSEENKEKFLQMVRDDGYADPDEPGEFDPPSTDALRDIENLRPIGYVFPKEQADKITAYAMMTAMALGVERGEMS